MSRREDRIRDISLSTFEELGFLLPAWDDGLDDEPFSDDFMETVRVRFSGPCSGVLELGLSPQALEGLASNMLAVDGPPEPALLRDALGEAANVICGNLTPVLADRKAVFRLEAPAPVPEDDPLARVHPDEDLWISLDAGAARVRLFLDPAR